MKNSSNNLNFSWQFRILTLNTYFCILYKCVSALGFHFLIHSRIPSFRLPPVTPFPSKLPTVASMPSFWRLVCTELLSDKVVVKHEHTCIKHKIQKVLNEELRTKIQDYLLNIGFAIIVISKLWSEKLLKKPWTFLVSKVR